MKAYKAPNMVDLFGRIKKMSYRQFENYMFTFAKENYEMGLREGEAEADEGTMWAENAIFRLMVSKGIAPFLANEIIDIMINEDGIKNYGDNITQ